MRPQLPNKLFRTPLGPPRPPTFQTAHLPEIPDGKRRFFVCQNFEILLRFFDHHLNFGPLLCIIFRSIQFLATTLPHHTGWRASPALRPPSKTRNGLLLGPFFGRNGPTGRFGAQFRKMGFMGSNKHGILKIRISFGENKVD